MFQSNAFQSNAFQSSLSTQLIPNGNNGGRNREYQPYAYELQNNQAIADRQREDKLEAENEARAVQYKLDDLEFRRLRDLADESMQLELLALLQQQQDLQNLLVELELQRLIRQRNEDDLLVILMCLNN